MSWWQSAVLGVVEGLTEYLPVSSTGHLILTQRALGMQASAASNAYAITIQTGAIAAVLGLYRERILQLLRGVLGKDPAGRAMTVNVIVGFVPAAVLGLALGKTIKRYLFGLWPVTAAWLVGGVAILAVTALQRRKGTGGAEGASLEAMTVRHALIVGCAQCLAMWPGTSRSLVTIVGGVLAGLSTAAAVEFSFLLGLLTLSAAAAHDVAEDGRVLLASYGPVDLAVGFVTAMASAFVAVRWMVDYLKRKGLAVFGYYRIALALVVGALLLAGVLDPGTAPAH
ncbi:MAG: undecaprenyl-diphosphate phosphatase [Deltaproteobacteria bacterium]|nr:undecaprenyl-diphosphate phosphatase [Deltaproteobacteria bacterium]